MEEQDRADGMVVGGVDTHRDTHVGAVVDPAGRLLGSAQFPADATGYGRLVAWMESWGRISRVGVEGTGSYGAGLARHLIGADIDVVEVNRPNRQLRRRRGKDDHTDAEAAARAALNGEATAVPKSGDGPADLITDADSYPPLRPQGPHSGCQPTPCPGGWCPRADTGPAKRA